MPWQPCYDLCLTRRDTWVEEHIGYYESVEQAHEAARVFLAHRPDCLRAVVWPCLVEVSD